jgi:hypothetical protein
VKTVIIATAILGLAVSPAAADPITANQAVTELTAAIDATNSAEAYAYTDSIMGWTASFNRTTGQYEQNADDALKVFNGTGTYLAIRWPSTRVKNKVLSARYLNNPALQWQLVTGRLGDLEIPLWTDLLDPRGERRGLIYFPPRETEISYADKTLVPGATRYTIGDSFYEQIYTVDPSGRITRLENTRAASAPISDHVQTWEYAPVSVTAPAASTFLPYETVQRAIEAASLDKTIKSLAQGIATSNRGRSLARMRVMARERVGIYNGGGEDEQVPIYVKLRIRNVAGGVRIYRTNPITGTFHEWRVTRGPNWRAVRTAP